MSDTERKAAAGRWALALGSCLLCVSLSAAVAQSPPESASAMQIQKILLDRELFGPDALALLATLQFWKGRVSSLVLFPDYAMSGNRYDSAASAEETVAALSGAMKTAPPKLRAEYQTDYSATLSRVAAFQIRVERVAEDDAFHLVVRREGGKFLKPGIEVRTIVARYGKPEHVSTEVVQARGDRRPAILTLNSYAGGAIQFVQSDLSPSVGTVDRVVVEVDAIAAQIY